MRGCNKGREKGESLSIQNELQVVGSDMFQGVISSFKKPLHNLSETCDTAWDIYVSLVLCKTYSTINATVACDRMCHMLNFVQPYEHHR